MTAGLKFIAQDVEESKLFDLWPLAVNAYNTTSNRHQFDDSFEIIKKRIIEMTIEK
jgi:hypothetical protein